MSGLLSGVLPAVYSASDRLKRNVKGLLSDPAGAAEQTLGLLSDASVKQQNMLAAAFQDPRNPWKVTDPNALEAASMNALTGLLGFAPAGMMAGVGAKTADKAALAKAQELLDGGANPADVWKQTGWAKGPDQRWRFEISDHNARPLARTWGEGKDLEAGMSTTTRRQRAIAHPELSAAYPKSKNIPVTLRPGNSSSGAYTEDSSFGPMISAYADPRYGHKADPSTMLHELQHAVQSYEGFAAGGSPKQADIQDFARQLFNQNKAEFLGSPDELMKMSQVHAYRRLAGEAEARLTQSRMNLTPQQRLEQYPYDPAYFQEATGVPLNSLIFR